MEENNKKKTIGLILAVIVIIAVFAVITVLVTVTTEPAGESTSSETTTMETSQSAADGTEDGKAAKTGDESSNSGNKEAAEELIDQTVSREEIEKAVGAWNKFNMDGNGCERGVYAGRFYYSNFVIYSRTYDKGKTFHIMSIN